MKILLGFAISLAIINISFWLNIFNGLSLYANSDFEYIIFVLIPQYSIFLFVLIFILTFSFIKTTTTKIISLFSGLISIFWIIDYYFIEDYIWDRQIFLLGRLITDYLFIFFFIILIIQHDRYSRNTAAKKINIIDE